MWSNKYIGIPYLDNGRDTAGTDCWGLVRLIYKEELSIDLPSFYTDYAVSDTDRISELMSQYQEGWEQLSLPEEKCVVLFRILGKISHIGIMLNERQFIHTRKNQQASIESIDSIKWKNRVVGYYKYNENAKELFDAAPHALKATELVIQFDKEFTIADAFTAAYENEDLPENLKKRIIVFVDGVQVDIEKDGNTFLVSGQRVEYRLVPDGEDIGRTLLTILVIYAAIQTGLAFAGAGTATAGSAATAMTAAGYSTAAIGTAGYIAQAGVMMVGMALVNAIAPVRPMDMATISDAGSSNPQLLLTGARNEARQYEAIPVVLGTYRYVPPVAAVNFLTVDTDNSYLRMLLCWGYGPLRVDKSSLRIGATDFNQYLDLDSDTYISEASEVSSENTTIPEALSTYGTDTSQQSPNIELPFTPSVGDPLVGTPELDTVYRTISEDITSLSVSIHFPQGLRGIYKTGASAGGSFPVAFTFEVRARKLNPDTLLPEGAWFPPGTSFYAQPVYPTIGLAKSSLAALIGYGGLQWTYVPGYTTSIIYLTKAGVIAVISGPPCTSAGATIGITGGSFPQIGFDGTRNGSGIIYSTTPVYTTAPAVPTVPAGGTILYTVKTLYTNANSFSVLSTVDTRVANGITGGGISSTTTTNSKITLNLDAGGRPSSSGNFTYGLIDQPYYLRKDAFTDTVNFNLNVNTASPYEISIQRTSPSEFDFADRYEYKLANLFLITGQNAQVAAVKPPKNTTLALSGLRIKATDQLNGSIEGISAQVSSLCKDYNTTTNLWSTDVLPTSNPAALFRYVLQHPANIQAVAEVDINTKLDMAAIEDWYEFCELEGLTYNAVITQRRSLLEVMRDICAAGKASPMLINGKWSVIIDRPRTTLVQHFTPHNSWGFEGTRVLSSPPHALRVNVVSATKGYQTQELTVYSYSSKVMQVTTTVGSPTATVTSTVPLYPVLADYPTNTITVTKSTSIPLNTTIVSITNATTFVLSANATTTGTTSVTFNVPYYNATASIFETISLPGVTDEEQAINLAKFHLAQSLLRPESYSLNTDMEHLACNRGDLVRVTHDVPMWGISTGRIKEFISTTSLELSEEIPMDAGINYTIRIRTAAGGSVVRNINPVGVSGYYQTITLTTTITSIEGAANNLFMLGILNSESAEMIITGIEPSSNLTARINLVDYSPAVYTSDDLFNALPSYNTQITSPTTFFSKYLSSVPVVAAANIRSDESVMEISGSSYVYKISIPFSNPAGLEKTVTDIEYRMCLTSDTSKSWRTQGYLKLSSGSILLSDVIEGLSYSIQLRYVSSSGFTGPWCTEVTHVIVGKTTVPGAVTGFTAVTAGADIKLSWTKSPEVDVVGYEIRTTDANWGTAGSVFTGNVTTCTVVPAAYGVLNTYYIKALDAAKLFSVVATTSITVTRPGNITIVGSPIYSSTSTGQATVTMNWSAPTVSSTQLALKKFLITVTRPVLGNISLESSANASSVTFDADWEGTATFNVITVDLGGNQSTSFSSNVVKLAPNVPTAAATPVAVNGKAITINWTPSVSTSLPIAGYQLSTSNADPKVTAYLFKGNASTIDLGAFIKGVNTWYLWAYDTAGKYSATALTVSRTFAGAEAPVVSTPVLKTDSIYFKWATPASDFAIATYNVSLAATGMTTITATISTTEWEVTIPPTWNNQTGTLTVTPVDVAGFTGAVGTNSLSKASPGQVSGGVAANITLVYASTGTGQIATIDWAAPTLSANQLAIKHYLVTITKPVIGSVNYTLVNSVITTNADWEGDATISITAVDTSGISGTALVKTLTKVAPSVPTAPVVTVNGSGVDITWTTSVAGSLPVAGYQLSTSNSSPAVNAFIYKGNASKISIATVSASNTWYLFAYDTAGKYCSTPVTVSKSFAGPTVPQSMAGSFTTSSALFKWLPPATSEFAIERYDLTLTAAGMTSITTKQYSTSWEVPVGWTNTTATLTILPVDVAGFIYTGGANTVTLTNAVPTTPSNPVLSVVETSLDVDWADNIQLATQLSTLSYEIKIGADSIWRGSGSKAQVPLIGKPADTLITYNLLAYDYNNIPSAARVFTYTPVAPTNITGGSFTATFGNSLTDATLTLNWVGVTTTYGLDYYEVTYDAVTVKVSSTSLTISPLPNAWIGNKTFTVKTVDLLGNKSSGTSIVVTKSLPAILPAYSSQVIDNNVMLYWTIPERTSLPISFVRIKKGVDWATGTLVGDKSGTFTTIFERSAGIFNYWLAAVDTDSQEGVPISLPTTVSQPPDFIFNGELSTAFGGTFNNAILDTGRVVLPVNASSTYASHFTNIRVVSMTVAAGGTGYVVGDSVRLNTGTVVGTDYATATVITVSSGVVTSLAITQGGAYTVTPTLTAGATTAVTGVGTGLTITVTTGGNWTTPAAQVSAGFPVFIQPTLATGYYEEVFDFGTVLNSSQVTLTVNASVIDGSPLLVTGISTSNNGTDYSIVTSSLSIFATNFRYVKVRVLASQSDVGKGLYAISYINIRLDSKILDWSGITNIVSTDTDGTLANFGKEFVDISAIAVTPTGTTFAVPVYDFKDVVLSGTYSVVTNVCTVTTSVAHGFSANALGQQVRLSFNTGTAPNGVYSVTSVSSTTVFTVALVTANTSGTLSAYSQGMRIYLFNAAGARISGTVSWSIRGN